MLCSHSVRDGPRNKSTERGSATRFWRSKPFAFLLRRRKVQEDNNEMPTTSLADGWTIEDA
jgi:hypothetical protein